MYPEAMVPANLHARHPLDAGQQQTVSGKVTDSSGSPLPGVTVVVKGTTQGTVTNADGEYSLSNIPEDATLVFSFVGMRTQEIEIGNQSTIDVAMEIDAIGIEEVVAVGYGTMRKRDVVGAISSVKTDDISLATSASIGHSLQGKAAGLMIRQNSAQPGGGLDILIRGGASINASNAPLIVVDGFPISELNQPNNGGRYDAGTLSVLNSFNPNDIESIEVLKDASATAIYGSRAANGVILITTKRGKEGKVNVQYSANYAFQNYKNEFDVLPLNEWMQVRNEAAKEDFMFQNQVFPYGDKTLEEASLDPIGEPLRTLYTQKAINNVGKGTDWLDLVTRNGTVNQHNISVNGGSPSTKYLVSGNFYQHKGVIKNSAIERFTFRTNIDQKISEYVNMGLNLTASRINNDNSQLGGSAYENSGIIRAALQQGPHIRAIDENGYYPRNPQLSMQPNPYSLLTITDNGQIERMLANTFLEIKPISDLTIRLNTGLDRGKTKRGNYLPQTTLHGELEKGKASIAHTGQNDYLLEATVNYAKTFIGIHQFNVLAGINRQKTDVSSVSTGNTNFISDVFLWYNLNSGAGIKTVGSSRYENTIASYFGRLNYNLRDRYLLTFTIRTDGSGVFSENNKWATFPSAAIGWNMAEENFMSDLKHIISQFKIRLSHGQTGNADIGSNAFAAYTAYPAWLTPDESILIGVSTARLANPDLKWETTTETNFGIDYNFFNGRIGGSFEYFSKVISDLLAWKPINSYHEVDGVMSNIGETQSKGFELTVNTLNVKKNEFTWRSTITLSKYEDKWRKRADDWKPAIYQSVDDPIRPIYSRLSDGIMQIGEIVTAQPELKPGMIKIKDIDGFLRDEQGNPIVDENGLFLKMGEPDGIIDDADTKLIGSSDPDLMAGFTNIINYKKFTLNFHFYGMFGRQLADPNYTTYGISADGVYTYGYNALRTVKDRWTPDNPSTTQPSSHYGYSRYGVGDFFLQDAWFIRLQNISLGYDIPQKYLGNMLSKLNVHLDAQNLFWISPYSGIDPETDSYTAAYPNVKTYSVGVNVTF
ncbi:MAG: SusC/RagA family TonB-linked outer membrane protein [Bacteroidales bacterium]